MMAPNITIDSRKLTVEAVRNTPMRNSDGGRIGSAAWCSHTTKAPMKTADTSSHGDDHRASPRRTGCRPTPSPGGRR